MIMKSILHLAFALSIVTVLQAQNPSMTIAHSGLSPSDELTIYVGDSIDFFYGSGGDHPMTEGWQTGEASSPIPFVTQAVSSSIPSVTFSMNTAGIYYFHCGTNPSNSNNWGKITVLDTIATGIPDHLVLENKVYPNPVSSTLTIEGLEGHAMIYDVNGKMVMTLNTPSTNISSLSSGIYFIEYKGRRSKIIKQ